MSHMESVANNETKEMDAPSPPEVPYLTESLHRDVVEFIVDHGRLPVLPADESELQFTPYGTTRALRPPLSYIASALTTKLLEPVGIDHIHAMRLGSSFLCAASVVLRGGEKVCPRALIFQEGASVSSSSIGVMRIMRPSRT